MQFQPLFMNSFGIGSIALVSLLTYIQPGNAQVNLPYTLIARVTVSDAAAKVKGAIDSQSTLKPFKLNVMNEGNMIVLAGEVKYNSQRQFAESIARTVAPSFSIDNRISLISTR